MLSSGAALVAWCEPSRRALTIPNRHLATELHPQVVRERPP